MKVMDISGNRLGVQDTSELFGIEIEVENCAIPDYQGTLWNVIEDGSLRNSGFEFVSRPCNYDDALTGIELFYRWKRDHGYATSIRTSTHVHYNVLGWETTEIATVMTAYSIIEPLLFRFCGQEREENIYCVPWYRAPNEARLVRKILEERTTMLELACKYSALYLEPIVRFGTVEFRHAPVFDDAGVMRVWLDLIRGLMTEARKFPNGEAVIERYDAAGADAFVQQLFGIDTMPLRASCEKTFEEIIEETGALDVATACVPSLYTYKATDSWEPTASPEGDMQAGYHRTSLAQVPMYGLDEPDAYYDEEEEHEREEW